MLLIDGVKYELWTPKKEVEELHPLVKEHYREIFGKKSIFIEGSRLESESGKGSVPDGFVITLGKVPQWHIVEMELSTHQLYDHIVKQVGRFISGVKSTATQKKIIEAIYHYIQENKQIKAEFEEAISSGEVYKFLADLITKSPVLVIIIEERTRELDEALDLLKYSPIEVREFQTFRRVGAEVVHAHLFEPLYKPLKNEEQKQIVEVQIVKGGPPEGVRKVAAGDFTYRGNGIFVLKSDLSVTINVRKREKLVEQQLDKQGLGTKSLNNFCYDLRRKAGLLHTPMED